jgi:hypothetical protein
MTPKITPAQARKPRRDATVVVYVPVVLQQALLRGVAREMCSQSAYIRRALADRLRADGHLPQASSLQSESRPTICRVEP